MEHGFSKKFLIGERQVGEGLPALLVAEIGGNHGGDMGLAESMVRAAAEAGAGAVKFQAYKARKFLSYQSPYFKELAQEELAFKTLLKLFRLARNIGLAVGVTVFDSQGLELAEEGEADFIKIASGDLTHGPLLRMAARAGRPVFISTGAAMQKEVCEALDNLSEALDLVLLQCTALYPAPVDSANLGVIRNWQDQGLLAGYSDHSLGLDSARAALALGAVVLEKHFTTDPSLPGGDNAISSSPEEWRELARWAALCPTLMGQREKAPHPAEWNMRPLIRRVLAAGSTLTAGHRIEENDLVFIRPPQMTAPESLLPPDRISEIVGRVLKSPVSEGSPLTLADFEQD